MSAATASTLERYMFGLINDERTSRGLQPLVLDLTLNASADAHSEWMLETNIFSHTGAGGSSSTDRMVEAGFDFSGTWRSAENIAAQSERGDEGLFDDVYDLHLALMNSAGHRANILMPELEVVGIGIQTGQFTYDTGTYFSIMVTQNFAQTGGVTHPDTGEPPPPANDPPMVIEGDGLDNVLVGGNRNDTITGHGGDDTLIGGDGMDVGVYGGVVARYGISIAGDDIRIVDRLGTDGTDLLDGIERLEFSDSYFKLHKFTNVSSLSDADLLTFCELYVAYFNRAPDAAGLLFWGSRLAEGKPLKEIARDFFDQPETQALYGQETDLPNFVTSVYHNVLGRAPDQAGFDHWMNKLTAGRVEKAEFILAIINGAKAPTGGEGDAEYLATKAEIGAYFAVVNGLNNVGTANTVMQGFDGSVESVSEVKEMIDAFAALAHSAEGAEFTIGLTGVLEDALDWA